MKVEPIVYLNIYGTVSFIPRTGSILSADEFNKVNAEYFSFKYYQSTSDTFFKCVEDSFLKSFSKPFMVITDSFGIPQFSSLQFSNDLVNIFNRDGLHIFINEPLVKYTGQRQTVEKSNLNSETFKSFDFSNARFEMTDYAKENLKSFPLDSINDLISLNNLTNVSVYTPDYNAQTFFARSYPLIKLYCQDLFLSENIKHIVKLPEVSDAPFTHKFMSSNWRYASHRHLVMAYLINYPGRYSWYYTGTFDQLNAGLWFDLNQWPSTLLGKIRAGIDTLNHSAPLNLDFNVTSPMPINGDFGDWLLLPTYDDKPYYTTADFFKGVFCAVINECDFPDPTSNISEKTLLAIKCKRPFVLVGQPNSLDYAMKLGFKTFGEFWDESYDAETNHEKRFIKIFETIDYINSLSLDQLIHLYKQMLPIIEHNYDILNNLASSKTWPLF